MSCIISYSVYAEEKQSFRDMYYGVCLNETSIFEFSDYLELYSTSEDEIIQGYAAVIWFLWVDYYVNPIKKWNSFNKGKDKLEELIKIYPTSIELRFLRLITQDNLPKFLGYNKNIEIDRLYIHGKVSSLTDLDLKDRINEYLCLNSINKI